MSTRPRLGLVLLLGTAVSFSAFGLWRAVWASPHPEMAQMHAYDQQRFKSVKPLLPRSGAIRYREDDPPDSEHLFVFRFTQFVVAPSLLSEEGDAPLVLVNGRREVVPCPQYEGRPMKLLHDAGNGVRLYGPGEP